MDKKDSRSFNNNHNDHLEGHNNDDGIGDTNDNTDDNDEDDYSVMEVPRPILIINGCLW